MSDLSLADLQAAVEAVGNDDPGETSVRVSPDGLVTVTVPSEGAGLVIHDFDGPSGACARCGVSFLDAAATCPGPAPAGSRP